MRRGEGPLTTLAAGAASAPPPAVASKPSSTSTLCAYPPLRRQTLTGVDNTGVLTERRINRVDAYRLIRLALGART
jgi:hypothetical protein